MVQSIGASDVARRIAAMGIPHAPDRREPIEIPPRLWRGAISHLVSQRMTGLAVEGVARGELLLDATARAQLLEAHRDAMTTVLGLDRRLLGIDAAMGAAGVGSVVLKGAALAHAFYPDPAMRSYGDLDLLVRGEDWSAALDVLGELGFRRLLPEPRPGFDLRFGKGAAHEHRDGIQVDLHRTIALGPFGLWIDADALADGTEVFRLGGRTLRRLSGTCSFVHACVHAVLGSWPPRLVPLRDVVQVAWTDGIDWDEIRALAARWRLRAPMALALRTASETLDVELPVEAGALLADRASAVERRALAAYVGGRRSEGGMSTASLLAIPGVRARAAYAGALLFPRRAFLEARAGEHERAYRARRQIPLVWLGDRLMPRRPRPGSPARKR
jgi:hypothetical protein